METKQMSLRPTVVTFMMWSIWVGASAHGVEQLVRNGSFEVADEAGKLPARWSFAWKYTHSNDRDIGYEKQEPDFGLDAEVRKVGARSFRIGVKRQLDDGVLTQEDVPAREGTSVYVVKAWLKTADMAGTSANVALVSLGERGKWLGASYSVIAASENHDWRKYTGYFMAHPKAATFRVRLWLNFRYSGTGTAWYDDVRVMSTDLTGMPPIRYVDNRPAPVLDSHWQDAGYVLFRRSYLHMIFPCSVPEANEIGGCLRVAASPGEAEPISFCMRSLRDLQGVSVEIGGLVTEGGERIPASAVAMGLVKCIYKKGQARWGAFADGRMLMPAYVEPGRTFDLPASMTKQVWATVRVPLDAAPGLYKGKATVRPANSAERTLPIELKVLPISLVEPKDVFFGMYSGFPKQSSRLGEMYADMRAHGMTTIGFCGPLVSPIRKVGDRVEIGFDGEGVLEKAMAAYVRAGFPEPFVWLMSGDIRRWCLKQGGLESDAFGDGYREAILRVIEHGKKQDWPEIIFQPLDEPFEHTKRMEATKRCLQIMKTVPGLRTEEDGPNGNPAMLEEVYDLCDVIVLHDGPVMKRRHYDAKAWQAFLARTKRDGKQVWFYNIDLTGCHPEVMRWGYGFGLWLSGATGIIEWSYQTALRRGNPAVAYKNEGCIIYHYPPWEDEPGGPAIGWEAIREGVDDYKYIHLLHQVTAKARISGSAAAMRFAAEAEAYVKSLRAKTDFRAHEGSACQGDWTGRKWISDDGEKLVSGSYKMANGWTFDDFGAARARIANLIVQIQREL